MDRDGLELSSRFSDLNVSLSLVLFSVGMLSGVSFVSFSVKASEASGLFVFVRIEQDLLCYWRSRPR